MGCRAMKQFCYVVLAFLLACCSPAAAQWQVQQNAIPLGRGGGNIGFNTVGGSGGAGTKCLVDTVPPSFGACSGLNIGTTPISGGVTGRVLMDNAGFLGEYAISGTGSVAMTNSPVFVTPNIGAAIGTSLALGGTTAGVANLSVPTQIRIGPTNFGGASLLINATIVDTGTHTDVAAVQLSPSFPSTITDDAAGIFIVPSLATGTVMNRLYGVRAEVPVLNGTATLTTFKAFVVDDLSTLTVGGSKWAYYAEGAGSNGKAQFGQTTINSDTLTASGAALTVGAGTTGSGVNVNINGGGSGNGSGAYFSLQGGGTNFAFFGNHSAVFGGAFASDTVITSASGKKIEFAAGLTGAAFSQAVTTTVFPSGCVGIGTATDCGAGGLLATDLYSNNASFLIRTKTTLSNAAAAATATLTNAPTAGNPTKWLSFDDNGTTRRIPAW